MDSSSVYSVSVLSCVYSLLSGPNQEQEEGGSNIIDLLLIHHFILHKGGYFKAVSQIYLVQSKPKNSGRYICFMFFFFFLALYISKAISPCVCYCAFVGVCFQKSVWRFLSSWQILWLYFFLIKTITIIELVFGNILEYIKENSIMHNIK